MIKLIEAKYNEVAELKNQNTEGVDWKIYEWREERDTRSEPKTSSYLVSRPSYLLEDFPRIQNSIRIDQPSF